MKLRTHVQSDVMTYGLYDRLLNKILFALSDYVERRRTKLWEQ